VVSQDVVPNGDGAIVQPPFAFAGSKIALNGDRLSSSSCGRQTNWVAQLALRRNGWGLSFKSWRQHLHGLTAG
jgi:hypothetical protein